jgi:hypothetical protein
MKLETALREATFRCVMELVVGFDRDYRQENNKLRVKMAAAS